MVITIRITRPRWAGHIVRMQDNLPCKKITFGKPGGRRRVGRPNLRWTDGVMRVAERLGVRNWRIKAKDRQRRLEVTSRDGQDPTWIVAPGSH